MNWDIKKKKRRREKYKVKYLGICVNSRIADPVMVAAPLK
jgi:hypothetical protein